MNRQTTFSTRTIGLGWLALCLLAAAPALACIGEIPGFPRPIVLNKEKSDRAVARFVREYTINGTTWYIPNPTGFVDIETRKSRDELAHWEEVAAFNLRENNLAFFAASDAIPPAPEFSQAHIYIDGEQWEADDRAEFRRTQENPSPDQPMSQAMLNFLTSGAPIDAQQFARALNADFEDRPYVFFDRNGQRVMVKISVVQGCMTEEDERAMEESRKRRTAQATVVVKDGQQYIIEEMTPPGESHVSFYPSIETSLVFESRGSHVSMLLNYGPLAKPQDIGEAVTTLFKWKADFENANR